MQFGYAKVHGTAPANSAVELIDDAGNPIAKTTADHRGNWVIRSIALPIGRHAIRAVVETPNGHHCESRPIGVEIVNESAPETEADDEPAESEAEQNYATIVRCRAEGFAIAPELGWSVIAAAGRSMQEFIADVTRLEAIADRERATRDRVERFFLDTGSRAFGS